MQPLDVHHVSVCVTDMEAARTFYVDVLGFRERGDRPDFGFPGAWFDVGGRQVHLIEVPTMPPGAGSNHFALRVDDLKRSAQIVVGTPDDVIAAAERIPATGAMTFNPLAGGLPPDLSRPSLELFATDVLPKIRPPA